MTGGPDPKNHPICIVGGGLVGKVAALELAARATPDNGPYANRPIALIAPEMPSADRRTTAMLMPAIEMLQRLNLWQAIEPLTAPLKTMRLIDGSNRLIRAPMTDFHATEIDLPAFGYNVPNADMLDALDQAIEASSNITWLRSTAETITLNDQAAQITLGNGQQITCQLVVAADGQNSRCREAAGIQAKGWTYPQTAVVLNFTHDLPHAGISAEFHTETGPFTQVPLPPRPNAPHRSSLVWLVEPQDAERLVMTDLVELSGIVEAKLQSSYGKCRVESAPAAIPMRGMTATQFGANRTVLIGESGHLFPPIGAQGFNLGLRDIRDLTDVLGKHAGDPGARAVTAAYDRKRQLDVKARTTGVDMMNRSLLTDFLPVQFARTIGLSALGALSPLRKLAMYQGMGMESKIPSLITGPGKDLAAKFRSQSGKAAPSR